MADESAQIGQVVHRIFPLARGLFEDKVANVWCFASVLPLPTRWKLKNVMAATALARVSLGVTLVAILPGCVMLFWAASQTAGMEMMVASGSVDPPRLATGDDVAGSVKAPTAGAASHRSRRSPSVVGSVPAVGRGPRSNRSFAGSVSKSLSGRLSHVGRLPDPLPPRTIPTTHHPHLPSRCIHSPSPRRADASLRPDLGRQCVLLFGFQTHEKSILLPLLPMTLFLGAKGDTWGGNITAARDWEWSVWFNNVATFSLFPLLKKDGQGLQYVVLTVGWNWFIGNLSVPFSPLRSVRAAVRRDASFFRRLSTASYVAAIGLHLVEMVLPRVALGLQARVWARYPDIYPVLNICW